MGVDQENLSDMSEEIKLYQPSNGTEGQFFIEEYCMNCQNCNPDPNGAKQCDILLRSLAYGINDEQYPNEWRYDNDGKPMCTEHKRWNWVTMGDPDDPENPNYVMPYNPNQTSLFE